MAILRRHLLPFPEIAEAASAAPLSLLVGLLIVRRG